MRKILSKVALAAAVMAGAVASANATVVLTLVQQGVGASLQSCNTLIGGCGVNFLFAPVGSNQIQFNGTIGDFLVQGTLGSSTSPGDVNSAIIQTSSLQVKRLTNNNAGDLFISLTGLDFTDPNGVQKTFFGSASNTAAPSQVIGLGNVITSNFYANADNLVGGTPAANTNNINCAYTVGVNGSCNTGSPILWNDPLGTGGGKFSLISEQVFHLNLGTSLNSNSSAEAGRLPEPVTSSLVGVALLGLALASRSRAKKA